MPSRNNVYNDLGWSYYPAKIDSRDGIDPETGVVDLAKFGVNTDLELNVNYEDRSSDPTAIDYYVLAGDVNVLQDAVLSIQRILGSMPHIPSDTGGSNVKTVSERIERLEDPTRYDNRFGGEGWKDEDGNTILGHEHTGGPNNANKIDLETMTDGKIGKDRIQLSQDDDDPLTSEYILYSLTDGRSVKEVLLDKMDKSGGSIENNLIVKGNVVCRSFGEIDCKDMVIQGSSDGISNISDSRSYSGQAKFFSRTSTSQNTAVVCSFPVRYNKYTVILRAKSSNSTSTGALAKIGIFSSGDTEIMSKFIRCNQFESTVDYQSFYFTVNHQRYETNPGDKQLYIKIWFYGQSTAHMWLDSITVMPIHTSVWHDD